MTAARSPFDRKVIVIAAKLYEAQETAKRLYRERYDEMVEPWRQLLRGYVAVKGCNELEAWKQFLEHLESRPEDTSVSQMLLMAAVVDLCEPEGVTP